MSSVCPVSVQGLSTQHPECCSCKSVMSRCAASGRTPGSCCSAAHSSAWRQDSYVYRLSTDCPAIDHRNYRTPILSTDCPVSVQRLSTLHTGRCPLLSGTGRSGTAGRTPTSFWLSAQSGVRSHGPFVYRVSTDCPATVHRACSHRVCLQSVQCLSSDCPHHTRSVASASLPCVDVPQLVAHPVRADWPHTED